MLIVAAIAAFCAQTVKGICGFGSALVAMPVFAVVFGPIEAVFLVSALDIFGGTALLVPIWRKLVAPLIVAVYLPMFAGQYIGTGLLTTLPAATVALFLGVVVLLFGGDIFLRPVREGVGELEALPHDGKPLLLGLGASAGLVGGVMAGLVGASGPPIVLYMRRFYQDHFFRAQCLAIFQCGSFSLVGLLWYRGAVESQFFTHGAVLFLPMMAGAWAGGKLAPRLSRVAFGRFVGAVLVAAGATLIATNLG
jgi:uncharacterized protein